MAASCAGAVALSAALCAPAAQATSSSTPSSTAHNSGKYPAKSWSWGSKGDGPGHGDKYGSGDKRGHGDKYGYDGKSGYGDKPKGGHTHKPRKPSGYPKPDHPKPCAPGETPTTSSPDSPPSCLPSTPRECAPGETPTTPSPGSPPSCAPAEGTPDVPAASTTSPGTPVVPASPTAPAPAGSGVVPTTTGTTAPATPSTQGPAGQAPTQTVGGTRQRSATARLSTPRRCASGHVTVRVRGRLIRRVTFLINGRTVRTVTVPSGRRSVSASLPVRRFGAQRQRVQARVTFRNDTASRTLNATVNRCAQGQVSPQFTG